jgi:hypothetical protein
MALSRKLAAILTADVVGFSRRTGDGALVEFRSVVDAVRCAIEVQTGMIERNAGVPQERRIEFRIGIHLGDVVEESDGDLMGDGVNIAARLEGIAAPGAICLSEDAYRLVERPKQGVVFRENGFNKDGAMNAPRLALSVDTIRRCAPASLSIPRSEHHDRLRIPNGARSTQTAVSPASNRHVVRPREEFLRPRYERLEP